MQIREFCYGTSGSELSVCGLCLKIWLKPHAGHLRIFSSFIPCSVIQEKITIHEFYYILHNKI